MQNSGTGPIYVSNLSVNWRGELTTFPLDKVVDINVIETVNNFPKDPLLDKFQWIQNKSGTPSPDVFGEAEMLGQQFDSRSSCVLASVFNKNNADLRRMSDYIGRGSTKFTLADAEVSINYFSSHGGIQINQKIPAVVGFLQNSIQKCSKIQLD